MSTSRSSSGTVGAVIIAAATTTATGIVTLSSFFLALFSFRTDFCYGRWCSNRRRNWRSNGSDRLLHHPPYQKSAPNENSVRKGEESVTIRVAVVVAAAMMTAPTVLEEDLDVDIAALILREDL